MRIAEITTIKPIKPLTPPQARISALKQQKLNVGNQLKAEKGRQKKQKETAKIATAQQTILKISSGS